MNCRAFERDLPEWIVRRLPLDRARRMQAHFAECPLCQRRTQEERLLQRQWLELPSPAPVSAIEARLAARMADASRQSRSAGLSARGFGGRAAAFGLCAVTIGFFPVRTHYPEKLSSETRLVFAAEPKIADESSLAQRLEKMRQTPVEENDAFLAETQQRHQEQRFALLGRETP